VGESGRYYPEADRGFGPPSAPGTDAAGDGGRHPVRGKGLPVDGRQSPAQLMDEVRLRDPDSPMTRISRGSLWVIATGFRMAYPGRRSLLSAKVGCEACDLLSGSLSSRTKPSQFEQALVETGLQGLLA